MVVGFLGISACIVKITSLCFKGILINLFYDKIYLMNRNGQFIYEGFNSRLPQLFTDMIMTELNTAWPADRCQLVLELRFVVMIPRLWSHSRGEIPRMRNRETKRKLITCQCNQLTRQEFLQQRENQPKEKNTTEKL